MNFDYAGDSSLNYGVYIIEFGTPGLTTASAAGGISIISDSVARRAEPLIYGIKQEGFIQIPITIGNDEEMSRAQVDRVLGWLLQGVRHGKGVQRWLDLDQDDMRFYRYKGYFTNPQLVTVDKRVYGIQLTFLASPFAYSFPQKQTLVLTAPTEFTINNLGSGDYLFPTLLYTPDNTVQTFSIINNSDGGREFRFDFAAPFPDGDETIMVNCDRQIIQSTDGSDRSRHRSQQFNMKWLRFVRGANELSISGNGKLEFVYSFQHRVGA